MDSEVARQVVDVMRAVRVELTPAMKEYLGMEMVVATVMLVSCVGILSGSVWLLKWMGKKKDAASQDQFEWSLGMVLILLVDILPVAGVIDAVYAMAAIHWAPRAWLIGQLMSGRH